MTTRESFLARVRGRLAGGVPDNPLRPMAEASTGPIDYTIDLSEPVSRFRTAAAAVAAEVLDGANLVALLEAVLRDVGASRVAVADDPACAGVADMVRRLGSEVVDTDDASAQLGITGAFAAVALTGSVVLDSSVPGSRLASLLPDVHLVVLSKGLIVPTPGDVLRRLPSADAMPSNLVFITGPSRTADIELQLTMGVHGPRRVIIALR